GRRPVLIAGYFLAAATMAGFAAASWARVENWSIWFALLGLAGMYLAVEEALEGAVTADLVPDPAQRGSAYGGLAAVNGMGDLIARLGAGLLMSYAGLPVAFAAAGTLMLAGALLLKWVR